MPDDHQTHEIGRKRGLPDDQRAADRAAAPWPDRRTISWDFFPANTVGQIPGRASSIRAAAPWPDRCTISWELFPANSVGQIPGWSSSIRAGKNSQA